MRRRVPALGRRRSGPGLLFIHGMNAHSRWWDFIAPQFAGEYRVAAMDLTGMGDSDFRYEYDPATYAREIAGVLDALDFGPDSIVVAHSFGGYMSVKAANLFPDRFAALVLVDSGIRHPDEPMPDRPPMGGRAKLYPDRETALARFRLQPPQPCENQYILDYIARHSLMPADGGWTWKFDDDLLDTLKGAERFADDYKALALQSRRDLRRKQRALFETHARIHARAHPAGLSRGRRRRTRNTTCFSINRNVSSKRCARCSRR